MSASVWLSSLNGNSSEGVLLSFGLHLKCLSSAPNARDFTQTEVQQMYFQTLNTKVSKIPNP